MEWQRKFTSTDLINGNGALCPCMLAIRRFQFTNFLSEISVNRPYEKANNFLDRAKIMVDVSGCQQLWLTSSK